MEIILTGTGSPLPHPDRAGPSTLVRAGDSQVLVDAGRGVVMRLAAAGSFPSMLDAVLLTHLHSDHICALNDVITTHWVLTQGANSLSILGPAGTAEFVRRQLGALEADIGYRLAHHDALTVGPQVIVTEVGAGESFTIGEIEVSTGSTEHAPVTPTIGFRFEADGVSAAIVGDTVPCSGVDELARGAGAYVQTVINRDLVAAIPSEMLQDITTYHSDVIDAAQTAQRVGAQRLVLTHMVPAPTRDQYPAWIERAGEYFDREVIIGDDLTSISL